VIYPAR
jgi:cation-transporting ATPase 13A2